MVNTFIIAISRENSQGTDDLEAPEIKVLKGPAGESNPMPNKARTPSRCRCGVESLTQVQTLALEPKARNQRRQASFKRSPRIMKHCLIWLAAALACCISMHADETRLPETPMMEQLEWANSGETAEVRANRLEAFWHAHLPLEDGGTNPNAGRGYGDGTHVGAIVNCAWQLARAYIETGQKDKALKMVNWLAKHESKTGLAPVNK